MKHRKPLKLETFLPYRLSLLSNLMSGAIAQTYEDKFGINMPEWRIMMILAEYPDISADEVCTRTRIEKSVVSRAVARLLGRHLVVRNTDEDDRRKSQLRLSETGLSVYDEVMPIAVDYEKQFMQSMSSDEITDLNRIIDKLLAVSIDMEKYS